MTDALPYIAFTDEVAYWRGDCWYDDKPVMAIDQHGNLHRVTSLRFDEANGMFALAIEDDTEPARQVVVTGVDGRPAGRLDEQHGTWTETP